MVQNLTGIRGFAATWVVIYHFQAYLRNVFGEMKWISPILDRGSYGVDLFFCLSGFIIAYVYFDKFLGNPKERKKELQHFFFKRFARLYPVYFFTTLFAFFMFFVGGLVGHRFETVSDNNLSFSIFFKNIFAIQILDLSPSLNYPSWSVSAEFCAYLLYPLLVYGLFVKFKSTEMIAGLLFFLSLFIYEYQVFFDFFHNDQIIRVLTEFVMGLSGYLLIRRINLLQKYSYLVRFLTTTFAIILLYAIQNDLLLRAFLPLSLLGIILANYFHNVPNKGLGRKVFVKLGLWSYSLYLTHGLIHYLLGGFKLPIQANGFFLSFVQLFLIFLVVLLVAKFTTEVVENPCRKFLLKKLS